MRPCDLGLSACAIMSDNLYVNDTAETQQRELKAAGILYFYLFITSLSLPFFSITFLPTSFNMGRVFSTFLHTTYRGINRGK